MAFTENALRWRKCPHLYFCGLSSSFRDFALGNNYSAQLQGLQQTGGQGHFDSNTIVRREPRIEPKRHWESKQSLDGSIWFFLQRSKGMRCRSSRSSMEIRISSRQGSSRREIFKRSFYQVDGVRRISRHRKRSACIFAPNWKYRPDQGLV